MSISCCKREPMERALFHGDDAHAAVTRTVLACEDGPRTGVVCNVGWLIDRCSNNDACKSESKTPTPCPTDRQSENEKEIKDERETINKPRTMLPSNLLFVPDHQSYWTFLVGLLSSFLCGCCGL